VGEKLAITFILPVRDETESLKTTVRTIADLAKDHLEEILIVTGDCSHPESLQAVEQLQDDLPGLVRTCRQRLPGMGGAVREAFQQAAGTHLLLMAADLETDPNCVPQLIEKMQEGCWDIVAGSRWLPGGGLEGYGLLRTRLNALFQRGLRLLYRTDLTDLTFAYRLYRREVLEGIRWEALGHPFLLECLLKPLRLGARVAETPCRWRRRPEGVSGAGLAEMLCYAPLAVRVRWMRPEQIRPAASGDSEN
jgi:glycosyltransferase involved in cell wall biosynthesis